MLPTTQAEDSSLDDYVINWANLLLRECWTTQNSRLASAGSTELTSPPTVSSLSDELPVDDPIQTAMVWGMASFVEKDDDSFTYNQDFRARYISALNEAMKLVSTDIEDVYSGDDDDA